MDPAPQVERWPGTWRESDGLSVSGRLKLHLGSDMRLSAEEDGGNAEYPLDFNGRCGLHCGEWLSCGEDNMAGDQVEKHHFPWPTTSYFCDTLSLRWLIMRIASLGTATSWKIDWISLGSPLSHAAISLPQTHDPRQTSWQDCATSFPMARCDCSAGGAPK